MFLVSIECRNSLYRDRLICHWYEYVHYACWEIILRCLNVILCIVNHILGSILHCFLSIAFQCELFLWPWNCLLSKHLSDIVILCFLRETVQCIPIHVFIYQLGQMQHHLVLIHVIYVLFVHMQAGLGTVFGFSNFLFSLFFLLVLMIAK